MAQDVVVLPPENLFTVIASIYPRIRRHRLASQQRSLAQRFAKVDRVIHNSEDRNGVAVPDEVFRYCCSVALRYAIGPNPPSFDVGRGYRQDVAFIGSRRETGEGVGR